MTIAYCTGAALLKRDLRLASLLTYLVCSSVILLTLWQVWTARDNTLSDIQTDTVNLTNALNTYTDGIFKQSELVLIGLAERVEHLEDDPRQMSRLRGWWRSRWRRCRSSMRCSGTTPRAI